MKCLSIANPWPSFILYSSDELPDEYEQKRTENRTWSTGYRGKLLIHAGKSQDWLKSFTQAELAALPKMHFGFIVGVVDLVDCVEYTGTAARSKHPWMEFHTHASGPICWILENAMRFPDPIVYRGFQGLFDVPDHVVATQLAVAIPARAA